MVLNIIIPVRRIYGLQAYITQRVLNNMAVVMLTRRIDPGLRLHGGSVLLVVQRRTLTNAT